MMKKIKYIAFFFGFFVAPSVQAQTQIPKSYDLEAYNFAQKCAALKAKEAALKAEKEALQNEVTRYETMRYEDDMKANAALKFSLLWQKPITEKIKCE